MSLLVINACIIHPDMTFVIDWALEIKYLSAVIRAYFFQKHFFNYLFFSRGSCCHRPDMTSAVDWALKAHYLSIFMLSMFGLLQGLAAEA